MQMTNAEMEKRAKVLKVKGPSMVSTLTTKSIAKAAAALTSGFIWRPTTMWQQPFSAQNSALAVSIMIDTASARDAHLTSQVRPLSLMRPFTWPTISGVAAAVAKGDFTSGAHHYVLHGRSENRPKTQQVSLRHHRNRSLN